MLVIMIEWLVSDRDKLSKNSLHIIDIKLDLHSIDVKWVPRLLLLNIRKEIDREIQLLIKKNKS